MAQHLADETKDSNVTTALLIAIPTALTSGYGMLISTVALVASMHPDEKVRADAAKVLDRLLRRTRR